MSRSTFDDDGPVVPEKDDRLAAAIDVGALLTLPWLVLWLAKLPAVEDVIKGGELYRSFWASIWPLAVAVGVALAGGMVAAAALRHGLFQANLIWLRWIMAGGVVVLAAFLGYYAPAVIWNADALKKYIDDELSKVQKIDKEAKEKAVRAAQQLGNEKARDAALKAIEDADKRNKEREEQSAKKIEEFRKLLAEREKGNQDAKKKAEEALAAAATEKEAREKAEARTKQIEEETKRQLQASNKAGSNEKDKDDEKTNKDDKGKDVPKSNDSKDDPVADFVKMAVLAAIAYYNPALAAVLSQVFGITLGTDVETIKTVGDAVLETFPGGKFDPNKVDAALQKLKGIGEKSEKAIRAYQDTLQGMKNVVDATTKPQIEEALEQVKKALETAPAELMKLIRKAVEDDWDKVVKDDSKPEDLVKLYKQIKETKFLGSGPQVRKAILELAEQKNVPAPVRKAAGELMQ